MDEVIRKAVRQALEAVMETERKTFLAEQGGKKNGHYQRTYHEPAGKHTGPPLRRHDTRHES